MYYTSKIRHRSRIYFCTKIA